jgi:hypothetical protein
VISLACCTFTLLSFLIDVSRFAYPERPIIYLGACFAMIAVALVVGFAVGDDIACDDEAGREVTYLLVTVLGESYPVRHVGG